MNINKFYRKCSLTDGTKFKILQGLYWSSWAFYYIYVVYYLNQVRGYSNSNIGLVFSIAAVANLIFTNFWGMIIDKIRDIKKILTILLICSTAMISTFPLYPTFVSISIVVIFIAFFEPSIPVVIDSWIAQYSEKYNDTTYSDTRIWGSICFSLVAVIIGRVALITNIEVIFFMHIIFALLSICIIKSIKFNIKEIELHKNVRNNVFKNFPVLLKKPDYIMLVICSTLIFMVFKYSMTFLHLKVFEVGGNESNISIVWVIDGIAEVPALLYINKLIKKFKFNTLLLFSFAASLIRVFLLYIGKSIFVIILAQTLQGLAFAVFISVAVVYVNNIAPEGMKTSAYTIASACYVSISGIIGSYLGGLLVDNYGLSSSYLFGILIDLIVICLFFIYSCQRQSRLRASEMRNT